MWPFKKKIKLTATTTKQFLTELFPIKKAESLLPAWYSSMSSSFERGNCPIKTSVLNYSATIKTCVGVNTLLRTGFIVPCSEDVSVIVYPDGSIGTAGAEGSMRQFVTLHDSRQAPPAWQNKVVMKFHAAAWHLSCSTNTKFMYTAAPYHSDLAVKFFVPSGIVDLKIPMETNLFVVADKKDEPYEIVIKAGQPVAHIIPLTESDVELELKYDPEFRSIATAPFFFQLHRYHRLINTIRKNNAG